MPKVTVGFIHPLMVHAAFMQSVLAISHRERCEVLNVMSGANVSKARNALVEGFLATDSDYLLMLDSDMVFRADVISRLVVHNEPIMNGMYFQPSMNGGPSFPCMYNRQIGTDADDGMFVTIGDHWQRQAVIKVDAVGAGFMMVRRDVFQDIRDVTPNYAAPWFQEVQRGDNLVGEDFTFCMRAAARGYSILVDTSVEAGHIKPAMVGEVR